MTTNPQYYKKALAMIENLASGYSWEETFHAYKGQKIYWDYSNTIWQTMYFVPIKR